MNRIRSIRNFSLAHVKWTDIFVNLMCVLPWNRKVLTFSVDKILDAEYGKIAKRRNTITPNDTRALIIPIVFSFYDCVSYKLVLNTPTKPKTQTEQKIHEVSVK